MLTERFGCIDDTVTDSRTGLTWQRHISEDKLSLDKAKLYAAELRLGGYEDWRVPTKEELLSIVDHTRLGPAIDVEVFPDTPSHWFWTVSPYSNGAWLVNFFNGSASGNVVGSSSRRVRCVRG